MPPAFTDHVALLGAYLDRRAVIVDAIERQMLNVQDKETSRSRDRGRLERLLAGFFDAAIGLLHLSGAHGTLGAAHVDDGFEPAARGTYSHRLDPVDLVARAYDHWETTRWPGRNGRIAFAHVVYAAFMLGLLEHLSLRIWDSSIDHAEGNLREVQRLLDRLNGDPIGPVFIRDARWLIQTAQGPLTKELAPYFRIAARIAQSFDAGYRLEVHKAGAVLAAAICAHSSAIAPRRAAAPSTIPKCWPSPATPTPWTWRCSSAISYRCSSASRRRSAKTTPICAAASSTPFCRGCAPIRSC